jgi:hypothetical protein
MERVYLGDGAYAAFDGYSLWVTTSDGLRDTNRICLEPAVFEALLRFAATHWDPAAIARIATGGE